MNIVNQVVEATMKKNEVIRVALENMMDKAMVVGWRLPADPTEQLRRYQEFANKIAADCGALLKLRCFHKGDT